MTREKVQQIILQGKIIRKSVEWLDDKIQQKLAEIDFVKSTYPIDYDRLEKLDAQLEHLYNKVRFEHRLNEEYARTYQALFSSGISPRTS